MSSSCICWRTELRATWHFERNDRVAAQFDATQKRDDRAFADAVAGEQFVQRVDGGRGRVVERDHDVALDETRARGGAVRLEAGDEHARVLLDVVPARDLADERDVLPGDADETAADAP